jgi:O-antigen ligase
VHLLSVWGPVAFLIFIFLFGGSGRSDVASLPLLRAGGVLFAFWAMLRLTPVDWRRIGVPLALLGAISLWMAIQLVPLPPSIWHGLPGRGTIVAVDGLLGQADLWRPMSLTPSQTFNSLLAMTVPFAALLVFAQADAEDYPRILFAVVGIACFSALLGLVQIFFGAGSGAYFYRTTNPDSMVGLFANRNHHAVFLAIAVIVAAMLLRDELMRKRKRGGVQIVLGLVGVGLAVMTTLIGSRSGMAIGLAAFAISYVMVGFAWRGRPVAAGSRAAAPAARGGHWAFYAPPLLLALLLGVALLLSSRTTALTRVFGTDAVAELRVEAWPVLVSMLETFWVFGSGFGSFPDTFKMFEPDRLLQPSYFNHAHNDWIELAITGGLPAAAILALALVWLARAFAARGARNFVKGHRGDARLPVLAIILLLAVASLVEYPLRLPSMQVLAILMMILLCCPKPAMARQE